MLSRLLFIPLLVILVFGTFFILKPKVSRVASLKSSAQNILPINNKKVTLIATGDVIPARSVNFQATQRNNFKWAFEKTSDVLKQADITLVNLESPLLPNCPIAQEGMTFCGDARHIEGLVFAGVDVVNLTNNHLGNYGLKGIESTTGLLSQAGISYSGLGEILYKEVFGTKFAFLGFNEISGSIPPMAWAENEVLKTQITEARTQADIVVVSFHWGTEYTHLPTPRQKELAHLAIDSGADLIIGNHPHWVQKVEKYEPKVSNPSDYKDKLIVYAHGNFVFDQMWSVKTQQGVVGKYTFEGKKLVSFEFLPVRIKDYGQPEFITGPEAQEILSNME